MLNIIGHNRDADERLRRRSRISKSVFNEKKLHSLGGSLFACDTVRILWSGQ